MQGFVREIMIIQCILIWWGHNFLLINFMPQLDVIQSGISAVTEIRSR